MLVTNQHSLSDAEDFTEGYRALGLGKVVGEPTAGWIIYTWGQRLIDGSNLRLPRMKVTATDGTNMELKPRPVDVAVTRPIGEAPAGRDSSSTRLSRCCSRSSPGKSVAVPIFDCRSQAPIRWLSSRRADERGTAR